MKKTCLILAFLLASSLTACAGPLAKSAPASVSLYDGWEVSSSPIISGSAADPENVYHGIESLFVDLNPVTTTNRWVLDPHVMVHHSGDRSSCAAGTLTPVEGKSDRYQLNYELYTKENGFEDVSEDFTLHNYYPHGFEIIDDTGRSYVYNRTVLRGGWHEIAPEDIEALDFKAEYHPLKGNESLLEDYVSCSYALREDLEYYIPSLFSDELPQNFLIPLQASSIGDSFFHLVGFEDLIFSRIVNTGSDSDSVLWLRHQDNAWDLCEVNNAPFAVSDPAFLFTKDQPRVYDQTPYPWLIIPDYAGSINAGCPVIFLSDDFGATFKRITLKDVHFSDGERLTDGIVTHHFPDALSYNEDGFTINWDCSDYNDYSWPLFSTTIRWDLSGYTVSSQYVMPE